MQFKYQSIMSNTTTNKSLVIDSQSRFLEMKSVQPYSTTDEYLYAMKEDLADWLSTMYPEWRPITAETFLECLENGVLLCQHANNVNNAARKAYALKLTSNSQICRLESCKYRTDARPQTFSARDNVSQFIKWARRVVGVREVLMFESDDLILRKNEKNFLLCLLEIARYGSQFGVSVPAIIQLEDEIEREIQRDKQMEIMSFTELRRLQREEQQKANTISSSHGKYSKLLKLVRHEHHETTHHQQQQQQQQQPSRPQSSKNSYNHFSLTHSNGANWLRQRISRIPRLTSSDRKTRHSSEENHDNKLQSQVSTLRISLKQPPISRTLSVEPQTETSAPASTSSLSQLHKTVVQMTDSCCCAQRFPVIRIGEGKYRIGETGAIIFIRILRYHVMVRVGGGWDTLENYLNKHDPCRRMNAHRPFNMNDQRREVPILAVPNQSHTSNLHKTIPYGKAVTVKTEEFPLSRPTTRDTNLTDAQLFITRDADGRHHIGQITYKSEEDLLTPPPTCPHHPTPSSPVPKVKSARGTGRYISPSTKPFVSNSLDQDDFSSPTSTSIDTDPITSRYSYSSANTSTPVSESISLTTVRSQKSNEPVRTATLLAKQPSGFIESTIDNIDRYIASNHSKSEQDDFDISDIDDVLRTYRKSQIDDDPTQMDEDSLDSCQGVIEDYKPSLPPSPMISHRSMTMSRVKPGGICTAIYLAQKRNPISMEKKYSTLPCTRSTTLPNVIEVLQAEEQQNGRSPSHRKISRDSYDGMPFHDISKLDRDSGFDDQDFRRERLQSAGEEDSSSFSSRRSSLGQSFSSDIHSQIYRENKAYELRLQALDYTRMYNEQASPESRAQMRRNFNYPSIRAHEYVQPTGHKFRKNPQVNHYYK